MMTGYRMSSICANESFMDWKTRSRFHPGATYAVSSSLLHRVPQETILELMREVRDSGPNNSTCLKEYVMERSWGRLWNGCREADGVVPADCACPETTYV